MSFSEKRLLFLVGCPRSGTTLLQEMLNAHPDIALAPELFYMRNIAIPISKTKGQLAPSAREKIAELITGAHWFSILDWNIAACKNWILTNGESHPIIYHKLLEQFASHKKTTWIGDKTPNNVHYIHHLRSFFPNARFIHMVRDPRAVVRSWKSVPWTTGTRTGDAWVWKKYIWAAEKYFTPGISDWITVRFEDLVDNTRQELTRICQFLRLDYSEAMEYYPRGVKSFDARKEPWKANAAKPVNPLRSQGWRKELKRWEITAIESVCHRKMNHYHYVPDSKGWERGIFVFNRILFPWVTFLYRKIRP